MNKLIIVVGCIGCCAADGFAIVNFTLLSPLPGDGLSIVRAVNSTGTIAVGHSQHNAAGTGNAARWVGSSGFALQQLDPVPPNAWAYAFACSASGTIAVGESVSQSGRMVATRWVGNNAPEELEPVSSNTNSRAMGVSANGNVAVGFQSVNPFRWTSTTGMTTLGLLSGGTAGLASAVSDDGQTAVGYSRNLSGALRAVRWAGGSTTAIDLGVVAGDSESEAVGISGDGLVVVGQSTGSGGAFASQWTSIGGMVSLGAISGDARSMARSANLDGSVVVGTSISAAGDARAFYWTQAGGMQDIHAMLVSGGIDMSRQQGQFEALDVTPDGLTVVGWGRFTNTDGSSSMYGWKATVPGPGVFMVVPALLGWGARRKRT